jgi:NDP-sugar pyrophosphorylase family protein
MIEVGKQKILTRLVRLLETHVDIIHVVVGYREDLVIDYCAHRHRDVVIVRNPDFHTTNTAHSFALGARHLRGKVLFLDGDLLVSERDLGLFLEKASQCETLIGLTEPKSEHTVFADAHHTPSGIMVTGFSRTEPAEFEWANIVSGPADLMASVDGYVFEHLSFGLPLPGHALRLAEVDTASDLEAAELFIKETDCDLIA